MLRELAIFRGALRTIWRFPLRSILTILSAVLGVAGALCSVNYAFGGRQKVTNQLARLGTNVLIVTPQQSRSVAGRVRTGGIVTTLTQADYAALRREVPRFSRSSAIATRSFLVKAGDLAKNNCTVIGVEPDYMAIKDWAVQSGNIFEGSDVRRSARVVILGSSVARDLFGDTPAVGERVLINRIPFQVIGVMSERGQGLDAANEDDRVYIPLSTAMRRLANVDYFSGIVFAVTRWEEMDRAAAEIREVLRRRHVQIGKLPEDFQVQNQKQLIDTQLAASDRLLFFVRWIGTSALAVSGLGVLAIAWISVKERTGEIGIRRALGATRMDIFLQVLWEAAVLSLFGCLAGLALAAEVSPLLAKWAEQPAVFDRSSGGLAASCAMGLNLIFALIPARTAARLDPIQALHFE
ncbi:MAG: ABC transporter permease [Bryobacteraceae bacterium]